MNKFSICIPTNKINQRLRNTLNSLSELKYPKDKIEINLFINGVEDMPEFPDVNSTLLDPMFLGVSEAKNKAINMATNEWIVLLDGDDFLVPSALKQYNDVIEKHPDLDVLFEFSSINLLADKGTVHGLHPTTQQSYDKFFQESLAKIPEIGAFGRPVLFKKSSLLPFNKKYNVLEERKLAIDYCLNNKNLFLVKSCTYVYNWNPDGVTNGNPINNHKEYPETLSRIMKEFNTIETHPKVSQLRFGLSDIDQLEIKRLALLETFMGGRS